MSLSLGMIFSLLTALVVILGDTLIKLAADRAALPSAPMMAGVLLYGVSAVLWYFAMRNMALAEAAVAYSMLTLLALCIIGAVAFGEAIGPRQMCGIVLAVGAMWLMSEPSA